jgi:UDP-N-acetylglucosamine--dolichyl-phosphate N-acetylglucosaminephosphotransferase
LLEPSVAKYTEDKPAKVLVGEVLKILHKLRLVNVRVDEKGRVIETSNLTIINLWLVWRGPLREDRLATEILLMQLTVGLLGLWARHSLALLLFSSDNRF